MAGLQPQSINGASPSDRVCRITEDRSLLDAAIASLENDLTAVGLTVEQDVQVRAMYHRQIRRLRDELRAEVAAGRMTWRQAAEEARRVRGEVMERARLMSSPHGRAAARTLKANNPGLNYLIARKIQELFGDGVDFEMLSNAQKEKVYAAIVESSGKSNALQDAKIARLSRAGRALIVVSVAISVYTVATADDPAAAAGKELAVTGAGIAGAAATGALAGLLCGPGAPVCVPIGAFVGGAAAALGVDYYWDRK